jgi:hypothetical protein
MFRDGPIGYFIGEYASMSTKNTDVFEDIEPLLERRSIARSFCGKPALTYFYGSRGVLPSFVRNISSDGANVRFDRLAVMPLTFLLSFDKFQSVKMCRLRWRDSDFVGVSFDN